MDKVAILVGGFHEMLELCEDAGVKVLGIIDSKLTGEYYGVPVIGKDEDALSVKERFEDVPLVITPDSPLVRKKLWEHYRQFGFRFMTLVSPKANVSRYSSIGEGTVIQALVNVSAGTRVGAFVKLNTGSNIMHDNLVGDFATVAPGAVSLGRVCIGESAYLGANCTVLPDKKVGEGAVIGAGAVVTHDVLPGTVVKGIPAKQ